MLIGGRNLAKAREVAQQLGKAKGVAINLRAEDLGLGERAVSAVAVLMRDEAQAGFRFARARGLPHIGIASGIEEIGFEAADFMQNPASAAVVLGTEWLVGATSVTTLDIARQFARIKSIRIGALLDDEDRGGPAQVADLEALTEDRPPALARRDGAYVWRTDDGASTSFRAVDGTRMPAIAISPNDVLALASATGARNVEFNLATGVSSSRRRGAAASTEILIEVEGQDAAGGPLHTRHAVVHPDGQFPLTGLGVAMVLERCLGLDGKPAAAAGLYFPSQLLEPASYRARLEAIGATVLVLEAS